jgi:hypothetical protein
LQDTAPSSSRRLLCLLFFWDHQMSAGSVAITLL